MELVSEYSLWFILLCLLLGAVYAAILYFKTWRGDLPSYLLPILSILRFITVSLIAFLLLAPLVKKYEYTVEEPVILIGLDKSTSMVLTRDSSDYRSPFHERMSAMVRALQKTHEVRVYSFGEKVREGFEVAYSDKLTDFSMFFNEMESRYQNRNVGAMIVVTDGIYNRGSDPYLTASKLPFPIYSIAMGDTSLRRDVIIKRVNHNKSVFLHDKLPVEVVVEMNKCEGKVTRITISHNGKMLNTTELKATSDHYIKTISFLPEATLPGPQKYKIQVDEVTGEENQHNNHFDILVNVVESRQQIAIVYDVPHPDIAALQTALSAFTRFKVVSIKAEEFNLDKNRYDLIILHQIPSIENEINLNPWLSSTVPIFFILGSQTDIHAFNKLNTGLIINSTRNEFTDALPSYHAQFSRFSVNKDDPSIYNEFPPLLSPFGVYQYGTLTDVLFYQKIGNVTSGTPLLMFIKNSSKKIGILAGENLWRWRISNYVQKGDHRAFDELFNRIAQYLAIVEDKSFFQLKTRPEFYENEPVEMEAELFNPSYELVNDEDVNIIITDSMGKGYPFVFSKSDNAYYLNAGLLSPGTYSYKADATQGKNSYQKSGVFTVVPLNIEAVDLVANHALLGRISLDHSAEMVYPRDMEKLVDKINAREEIHSVSYSNSRLSDLIGTPWLFLLILLLLTLEWGIRRRLGI